MTTDWDLNDVGKRLAELNQPLPAQGETRVLTLRRLYNRLAEELEVVRSTWERMRNTADGALKSLDAGQLPIPAFSPPHLGMEVCMERDRIERLVETINALEAEGATTQSSV